MFDVAPTELLMVAAVALLVIGPKDLPKAMRVVGKWVGRARGVARQFRSGFDTMVRESELAEMEKAWAAENERIMRDHPPTVSLPAPQPLLADADAPPDSEDSGPVMVEQPVVRPAPEPAETPALPAKPRKRKAPTTGDTLEAPKPAPPRKPRAKAGS
ncbi:MAG: Sec-independent protein translocase protein TatB [Pseudomonadota bacterium]